MPSESSPRRGPALHARRPAPPAGVRHAYRFRLSFNAMYPMSPGRPPPEHLPPRLVDPDKELSSLFTIRQLEAVEDPPRERRGSSPSRAPSATWAASSACCAFLSAPGDPQVERRRRRRARARDAAAHATGRARRRVTSSARRSSPRTSRRKPGAGPRTRGCSTARTGGRASSTTPTSPRRSTKTGGSPRRARRAWRAKKRPGCIRFRCSPTPGAPGSRARWSTSRGTRTCPCADRTR